jgi:Flp pilus assembly protein TadG
MGVMMAVAALPLCGLALGAVEYSRITMIKRQLQDAVDAATLAVARAPNGTPEEVDARGRAVLLGTLAWNGRAPDFQSVDFDVGSGTVTGQATLNVSPIIAHMVVQDLRVFASSEATMLGRRLEVALVLDNTYSMEWSPDALRRVGAESKTGGGEARRQGFHDEAK